MIRNFLKGFYRTLVWVCTLVGFILIGGGLFLYFFALDHISPPPKPLIHDAILTVSLNGSYEDHQLGLPGIASLAVGKHASLYDVTRAITHAATDKKVVGLILRIDLPSLGIAQIQEIREAIFAFRKAGKPTWCHADSFGELSSGTGLYYLATACDHITLQPLGMLSLTGLSVEAPFAKGALEKVGVISNLIQKKEYKSYEETFTREDFSGPAREAEQAVADSLLAQIVEGVSLGRKLSPDQVRSLIDKGPYLLEAAKADKLIDTVDFYDDLIRHLQEKFGKSVGYLGLERYLKTLPNSPPGDNIALIFASGEIQRGKGKSLFEGSVIEPEALRIAFDKALKDESVKGIVFRVDSPGGSPLAAETIHHTIERIRHHDKKPVIISMGNVAASGGYWIALPGSKIIAQPATLTGSIGAMGGKFIFSGLCDKLGIQWDHVSTSENASMWSLMTPYTPLQQAQVDAWIQQIYDAFINRVAKGRRMTKEQVEKVARGRIWTGEQACALGLVDQLGGLHTAIALAKKESGLSQDAGVIIFPKNHTLFEELIDLFQGNSTDFFIPPRVGIFTHIFHFFQQCSALFSHQESVVYAPLREIR